MGKKGEKPEFDCRFTGSLYQSILERDNAEGSVTCESPTVFQSTLTLILTATYNHVDGLHISLDANQEKRMMELRMEKKTEISELQLIITNLKERVSFTAEEISTLKVQIAGIHSSDTFMMAERVENLVMGG